MDDVSSSAVARVVHEIGGRDGGQLRIEKGIKRSRSLHSVCTAVRHLASGRILSHVVALRRVRESSRQNHRNQTGQMGLSLEAFTLSHDTAEWKTRTGNGKEECGRDFPGPCMGIYGGGGLALFLHNRRRAERDKIESSNADTE